jgi:hypothetical protein
LVFISPVHTKSRQLSIFAEVLFKISTDLSVAG